MILKMKLKRLENFKFHFAFHKINFAFNNIKDDFGIWKRKARIRNWFTLIKRKSFKIKRRLQGTWI